MQVGNNEYFTLGIAAWSGALYYPSDVTKKRVDGSIKFISNIGRVFKQVGEKQGENRENLGDQLTNIVKYMDRIAKKREIHSNRSDLNWYWLMIHKKIAVIIKNLDITAKLGIFIFSQPQIRNFKNFFKNLNYIFLKS